MAEAIALWMLCPELRKGPWRKTREETKAKDEADTQAIDDALLQGGKVITIHGLSPQVGNQIVTIPPGATVGQIATAYQEFIRSKIPNAIAGKEIYFSREPFKPVSVGAPDDVLVVENGDILFPTWVKRGEKWTYHFRYEDELVTTCKVCGKSEKFEANKEGDLQQIIEFGELSYYCKKCLSEAAIVNRCSSCGKFGMVKQEPVFTRTRIVICTFKCDLVHCRTCFKQLSDGLNLCGHCHSVSYCSKACQAKDWPKHKLEKVVRLLPWENSAVKKSDGSSPSP